MNLKFFLILLLTPLKLSSFIIQADKLEKNQNEIILFSDLHLPELPKSKNKQKNQNKKIKNKLTIRQASSSVPPHGGTSQDKQGERDDKKLTVLFEGYEQDQKNKFIKEQIKRSKTLSAPAYLDILTQTLKNKKVKLIPSDPRKNINTTFLNTVHAMEILSDSSIEETIEGTAKIKKLTVHEKIKLKQLEKDCPNSALTDILDILQNHYTLVEKPYLDKLKNLVYSIFNDYEKSCYLFVDALFKKITNSKDKKILVVAGQEHIEELKKLLLRNGYKIKTEIYDNQTIKFVQNLDDRLEDGNLTDINNQLEAKSDRLKIPDEAFNLI